MIYRLGLEGDFVLGYSRFGEVTIGDSPEAFSLSLNTEVTGADFGVVTEGLGLPDIGEVVEVTELDCAVSRLQRELREGSTLEVSERSNGFTASGGLGSRVRNELCSRSSRLRFEFNILLLRSSLSNSVGFRIIILSCNSSNGSKAVSTDIRIQATRLLTRHTLLNRDESVAGEHTSVLVDDEITDTDSVDVSDGHLDDGESVLLSERLEGKEVGLEAGIAGLVEGVVAVSVYILSLRDEGYQSLDERDLLFGSVVVHFVCGIEEFHR